MYFSPVDVVLRTKRLRKMEVPSEKKSGRVKKTWEEVVWQDPGRLGMHSTDARNHSMWRGCLRRLRLSKTGPTLGRGINPAWIK